ncbi:MAG: lipid-A-disaccharide synthase N-terminal domain-containing protein [Rhodobacter sp.]|nr:lipid-A-disaccharide synthase N-terminal domain-containing protein [Rhodobacter sp.]
MIETLFAWLNVQSWAEFWWVAFGLGGQLLFMSRFLVQWIVSEREKRSVIPLAFWYFSIGGGLILFTYAVYRKDPVFILGQSMGLFIYSRNLWLIYAERRRAG